MKKEPQGTGSSAAHSTDKSTSDGQGGAAIRPCACGAICWQCCGQVPGMIAEPGSLLDQSDSALQLRLTEYASMQSSHSGGGGGGGGGGNGNLLANGSHIRTLRSWSSSDRHGPQLDDSQGK
ncbi:hypothetical protein GGH95_001614, partial [Coemansia sp. RSA 1836]